MIYKCKNHENAQDWIRENYDPEKGIKNIDEMYNEIGSNHILINSVRIIRNQDPQPRYGMACIEELPSEKDNIKDINGEIPEVNINPIMVNRVLIGEACSPYEVIRVQTKNGLFQIVIIYDTGSEVSLCNYEIGPIVSDTKRGNKKDTISTINSIRAKLRQVYRLALNDGWSMEAIMIPNMKL